MSDTRFYEVEKEGYGEYEEKKSRFLAVLSYAANEEEAAAFIVAKKKGRSPGKRSFAPSIRYFFTTSPVSFNFCFPPETARLV